MPEKYTLSSHDELFKFFYIPIMDAAMNTATPTKSQMKRIKNWTGKTIKGVGVLSMGGGVGNDVIPLPSVRQTGEVAYDPIAIWGTSVLDWEAIIASGDDKGAFVEATRFEVESMMLSFVNNESRQYFGSSTGILGAIDGNAPVLNGDGTWTFIVSDATWMLPHWEVGNIINFHTNNNPFEITAVDKVLKAITVSRRTGSFDPTTLTTENVYMQNSKDKEMIGLGQIGDAVDNGSATIFGLRVQPRWMPYRMNGNSKPLIPEMLIELAEVMYDETGQVPSHLIMNAYQMASLETQLEGKKEYAQMASKDARYADIGYDALKLNTRYGAIKMFTDRFCPKTKVFAVNDKYWEFRERPKWGWLTFDGKQYLRAFTEGERPKYKANYGGLGQHFHHPGFLGVIHTLEIPAIG